MDESSSTNAIRLGLLGAGGIASYVADHILRGNLPGIRVVAIAGSGYQSESARELATRFGVSQVAASQLKSIGCDWVLEAAGIDAVKATVPDLWKSGINTVVMSVGAFIDNEIVCESTAAIRRGIQVKLPSGGIAGLDGVRALAASGGLRTVRITTTKAPKSLLGAPFLTRNGIELPGDRALIVFEGSARNAVAGFPANVNVAVALSLAGLGPDATMVTILSDPEAKATEHHIVAEGDIGTIEARISTRPSPLNPKTSLLTGASAVATLREIVSRTEL